MSREWHWKQARSEQPDKLPDMTEYLSNADNIGTTWANTAQLIATCDPATIEHLTSLVALSRISPACHPPHQRPGDNLPRPRLERPQRGHVGCTPQEIRTHITDLTATFHAQANHRSPRPAGTAHLRQPVAWAAEFYARPSDVWGSEHTHTAY